MVVVKSTKKILGSKFGPKGPKSGQKLGFLPVSQVWFISCLEIAYNDSLQQCITSSRGKTHETDFWGTKFGLKNEPESGPKLGFLSFSQVCLISFP